MEGYGSLKLTQESRALLKGQEKIAFRKDPPPITKIKKDKKQFKIKASTGELAPQSPLEEFIINQQLLQSLKSVRMQLAREQGVPPYIIFHDSTLIEMQAKRPQTLAELATISGVGQRKLERYGEIFLAALKD